MLRNTLEPLGDSVSNERHGVKVDRNVKAKSLLLAKNLENNFGEEGADWSSVKPGLKCFHSSIGSFPSQFQVEQLDDNVFKTPTKESPPVFLKADDHNERKVFFDISNIGTENSKLPDSLLPSNNNNVNHEIHNDNPVYFSSKFFSFNNLNNDNSNYKKSKPDSPKQIAATKLRRIWRYRLGSSGDRITTSPPHISHKDITRIKLKKLIGHGGFGAVYLGVIKDKIVAVKRLHKRVKNVRAKLESFRAECNVLNLKHQNIVQVLAASIGDPTQEAVIVMEFAGDCNLLHVINDPKQVLDLPRRLKYSLEITRALQFIHSNRVVHLDLKPANVIITSKDECKLGDFGCCRLLRPQCTDADGNSASSATDDKASPSPLNDNDFCVLKGKRQISQLAGTFVYRAPELLKGEPPGPRSDVYSLGVTMWQMLSRRSPYAGKDRHAIIFGVVAYNLRPSFDYDNESDFDFDTHYMLSLPRPRCLEDSFVKPKSSNTRSGKDVPVEERRYREVIERCWMASQSDRPWPHELIETFQMCLSEIG